MKHVYHYTEATGCLPKILQSGELRGRADKPDERPLVWFSLHSFWEPTATKPRVVGGFYEWIDFSEFRDCYGCVRFVLPSNDKRLMSWRKACKYAGIPKRDRFRMEDSGKSIGGNPEEWFALIGPVSLSELKAEKLVDNKWQPLPIEVRA